MGGHGSVACWATRCSMHIRRRPSAATFVAIVATLLIGTQTGLAAGAHADRGAPDPVSSLEVTAADSSSVTIAWPPSRDNDVSGYTVYLDGDRVGTQTPNQLKRWRDRDALTYTLQQLACGTAYTIGVDVYDRGDRHSETTTTTVSTAACPDSTPPTAPSGVRQVAATENAAMLTWTPSTDNVGVSGYGLYAGGLRVASSSDASATLTNLTCGTSYLVAIDAADAAGNRSTQATTYLATSSCPSRSTSASSPTTSAPATGTATTAPALSQSGTGTVTQTIANGSTITNIANWRAVYDRNGDGKEDDPGKIEFRVDGQADPHRAADSFRRQLRQLMGDHPRHRTPSRCARSATPAPSSPPTPPPRPSATRRPRRAEQAQSPRRSRTGRRSRTSRTGAPSTTATATARKTTPARSSFASTGS